MMPDTKNNIKKSKGLGRGLNALILNDDLDNEKTSVDEKSKDNSDRVIEVDINKIKSDKNQPRKSFDDELLNELAETIKEIGIVNPIVVVEKDNFYEIVTGERRWRAARLAELKKVPVIVKKYTDLERLEVSLIENIQREDLNPVEEAVTYKRFHDDFNLNQEQIAQKVGKSRTAVANSMRLLNLDSRVLNFLKEGRISSGHARTLLGIDDNNIQFDLAERIIEDELSVREIEDIIKKLKEDMNKKPETENKTPDRIDEAKKQAYKDLQKSLYEIIGSKVNIKNGKNKGKIEIEYYSDDELERIVNLFKNLK